MICPFISFHLEFGQKLDRICEVYEQKGCNLLFCPDVSINPSEDLK